MSVFGGFFDPADSQPTFTERIGNVVTAPFNWIGSAAGSLIAGIGGGAVNAVSTPFLILAGMILAALILTEVL